MRFGKRALSTAQRHSSLRCQCKTFILLAASVSRKLSTSGTGKKRRPASSMRPRHASAGASMSMSCVGSATAVDPSGAVNSCDSDSSAYAAPNTDAAEMATDGLPAYSVSV